MMAWMGAITAAAACNTNGKRRKKPSKLILLVTIFSLIMGIFVPLVMILGMNSSSSSVLFPLIFIFIMMIGMLVLVAAGFSESLDQDDERETADDTYSRNSGNTYRAKQRLRNTSYYENEPREDYYWGSESILSSYFCTNCGMRLEADDRFCSSCGRRVNKTQY